MALEMFYNYYRDFFKEKLQENNWQPTKEEFEYFYNVYLLHKDLVERDIFIAVLNSYNKKDLYSIVFDILVKYLHKEYSILVEEYLYLCLSNGYKEELKILLKNEYVHTYSIAIDWFKIYAHICSYRIEDLDLDLVNDIINYGMNLIKIKIEYPEEYYKFDLYYLDSDQTEYLRTRPEIFYELKYNIIPHTLSEILDMCYKYYYLTLSNDNK
jgi:hypothetical protein